MCFFSDRQRGENASVEERLSQWSGESPHASEHDGIELDADSYFTKYPVLIHRWVTDATALSFAHVPALLNIHLLTPRQAPHLANCLGQFVVLSIP